MVPVSGCVSLVSRQRFGYFDRTGTTYETMSCCYMIGPGLGGGGQSSAED